MGTHRFQILPDLGLVVDRFEGPVGVRELVGATARVNHHPDFRYGLRYLTDVRGAEGTLNGYDFHDVADVLRRSDDGARVAVLVSGKLQYGMVRVLGAFAEGGGVSAMHPFLLLEEACGWLGLHPRDLERVPWWGEAAAGGEV